MKKIPLPKEMNAIEIRNQQLVLTRRPVPKPKTGEILVKVQAAGINRPDILQRKGLYPPPKGITDIPGLELAGEVISNGKKFKKGQKICALVSGGGYAEYCIVPEAQCLPLPKGMDVVTAAGIPETFFTVWRNLFDIAKLKKGETVLIHGGASGIGTTAIQLAKHFGAKIIVTAGTEQKCKTCQKLGAHFSINYKTKDFVKEVEKFTKGKGVNIVLDMVGGDYVGRNLKCLSHGGRHVSIAMQKGRTAEIDIFQVMSKKLVLTGSTLRPQPIVVKAAIATALKRSVWPLLDQKKIKPVIDRIFLLKDVQKAHDYLESDQHVGKVILKV